CAYTLLTAVVLPPSWPDRSKRGGGVITFSGVGRSSRAIAMMVRPNASPCARALGRASTVVRLRKLFGAVLVIRCGMARDYSPHHASSLRVRRAIPQSRRVPKSRKFVLRLSRTGRSDAH